MAEDNLGRQSLHIASQTGACKSVQFLVEKCKVDPAGTCSTNGASALHIAAKVKLDLYIFSMSQK